MKINHRKKILKIFLILTIASFFAFLYPLIQSWRYSSKAEDYIPNYTCEEIENKPKACENPIKIYIKCLEEVTFVNPGSQKKEHPWHQTMNIKKACSKIPYWLEKENALKLVEEIEDSDLYITLEFSPRKYKFGGYRAEIKNLITKEIFVDHTVTISQPNGVSSEYLFRFMIMKLKFKIGELS